MSQCYAATVLYIASFTYNLDTIGAHYLLTLTYSPGSSRGLSDEIIVRIINTALLLDHIIIIVLYCLPAPVSTIKEVYIYIYNYYTQYTSYV